MVPLCSLGKLAPTLRNLLVDFLGFLIPRGLCQLFSPFGLAAIFLGP